MRNTLLTARGGASFADELRQARGDEPQANLARRMKYSASHYSNVENGQKPPTEDFARACDIALGTGEKFLTMLGRAPHKPLVKSAAKPAQLPPSPRLIGRTNAVRKLDSMLDLARGGHSAGVIALDGQAGVGKTTLAIAWAHRVSNGFPDGVLFVDLRGYTSDGDPADPDEVLEHMLKVLGVPAAEIPIRLEWRSAVLRTVLNGTRTLLVLDNAASIDQVRPLIPAEPGCLVVVTSRRRLSGLAVRHGAFCVTVDSFEQSEAMALLREVVGTDRVDSEADAARRIVALCDGLPLAVRVAAERVAASRHLTLDGLADELSSMNQRLDVLSVGGLDTAVRAVLSWSYRGLAPGAARMFRLLSLHPGNDFGADAASALAGHSVPEAARLLDDLAGVHLVHEVSHHRYRFHDLVRDYATERFHAEETREEAAAAVRLLGSWYLRTTAVANLVMSPNRPQARVAATLDPGTTVVFTGVRNAVAWMEAELANLAAVAQHAATSGIRDIAFGLPTVMTDYLYWRRPWHVWTGPLEACLVEARRCEDTAAQARILDNLANAYLDRRRVDEAKGCFAEALSLRMRDGDRAGQVWSGIGVGRLLLVQGDIAGAEEHFRTAQALCVELSDDWAWAIATAYLCDVHRASGDGESALEGLKQARAVMRRLGDRQAESCVLEKLSAVHRDRGDQVVRLRYLEQALEASSGAADRWGKAEFHRKLGHLHLERGDPDQARSAWIEALTLFEALGDTRAVTVRNELASLKMDDVPTPRCVG